LVVSLDRQQPWGDRAQQQGARASGEVRASPRGPPSDQPWDDDAAGIAATFPCL